MRNAFDRIQVFFFFKKKSILLFIKVRKGWIARWEPRTVPWRGVRQRCPWRDGQTWRVPGGGARCPRLPSTLGRGPPAGPAPGPAPGARPPAAAPPSGPHPPCPSRLVWSLVKAAPAKPPPSPQPRPRPVAKEAASPVATMAAARVGRAEERAGARHWRRRAPVWGQQAREAEWSPAGRAAGRHGGKTSPAASRTARVGGGTLLCILPRIRPRAPPGPRGWGGLSGRVVKGAVRAVLRRPASGLASPQSRQGPRGARGRPAPCEGGGWDRVGPVSGGDGGVGAVVAQPPPCPAVRDRLRSGLK